MRLDRPAARIAANMRPYAHAVAESKGRASHVTVAHWTALAPGFLLGVGGRMRCRRELGPGHRRDGGFVWQRWIEEVVSTTTEVSKRPPVGSAIDRLIDRGIDVGAETGRIDAWRPAGGLSDCGWVDEAARCGVAHFLPPARRCP